MRSVYVLMGSVLSCLLVLMVPRLGNKRFLVPDLATVTPSVSAMAQQFAQEDQPQQGDDNNANGDNPDQPQAGDENEGDAPQANPPDANDEGQQMNANPDDNDNNNADQDNNNAGQDNNNADQDNNNADQNN
jgi:hypothetical protein